jgi:mannose-6-phosphate isomerase
MDPLVFEPYLRPQVWGDRRLEKLLGKELPPQGNFGESWEISVLPHHVSRVSEGRFKGNLLTDLCATQSREIFGNHVPAHSRFPLLIKLLDCHDWLSVQVHPSDENARKLLGEENGKTEAWVILDVEPSGRIYAGLLPGITRHDVQRHLAAGTVVECLHSFQPNPGDCIFLPAGTVHAVGGGVVMAEVQQSSDATFRLFDWNRLGSDGKPRPLHIRESLESINWNAGPVQPVGSTAIIDLPKNVRGEYLVQCEYFQLARFLFTGAFNNPHSECLTIWIVLAGSAELRSAADGFQRLFQRGETVMVPAFSNRLFWNAVSPTVTLLGINLP